MYDDEKHLNEIIDFYTAVGIKGMEEMTEIDNRLDWEIPLLTGVFAQRTKLLDIGCGQGRIALKLAGLGYNIFGIDIVREFIDYNNLIVKQNGYNAEFYCDNFFNIDKYDIIFDGAYCMWGTIRYILKQDEQVAFFKKIFNHLKSSGKLLVDTIDEDNCAMAPNIDNEFQYREKVSIDNRELIRVYHKKYGLSTISCSFNEKLLKEVFYKAGFKNIERKVIAKEKSRLVITGEK